MVHHSRGSVPFLVLEMLVLVVIWFIALPGPLRHGYYNLLIALHLETHSSAR